MQQLRKNTVTILFFGLFGLTVLVWYAVSYYESRQNLIVTFFDVGQGDSIFIEVPGGNQVLIDGGPSDAVLAKLGTAMPFWDRSIDIVVLTHAHADHVTGLIEVANRYHIDRIIDSGAKYSSPEYEEWQRVMKEKHIPVTFVRAGQKLDLGNGARLDILSPWEDYSGVFLKNPHTVNVSTKLTYGSTTMLFMGDAEKLIEYRLVWENADVRNVDILKVGHHGSNTSSSEDFLKYVSPKYAVISVGRKNRYGLPSQDVITRLQQFSIPTFRTDQDGDVQFVSDRHNILQNK